MGNYNSIIYFYEDLQEHECNLCTWEEKYVYLQKYANKTSQYGLYVSNVNKYIDSGYENDYVEETYLLQACPAVENGDCKEGSYLLMDPLKPCIIQRSLLGKIVYTKNIVRYTSLNVREFVKIADSKDYFVCHAENSYTVMFHQLTELKKLVDGYNNSKHNILFIDNDGGFLWDKDRQWNTIKTFVEC